jgi:hypothetical protein
MTVKLIDCGLSMLLDEEQVSEQRVSESTVPDRE